VTPDSSTSPSPSPSWGVRNEGSAPEPCEVCTASAEEASRVLEKAWKDPRRACVRKRLNHQHCAGDRRPCAVPAFPAGSTSAGRCGWVWVCVPQGSCLAGGASSACSFELRAGLGDLRHRGIKPPVSRALGRPTAFLDWHRSFGSGVTRSPPPPFQSPSRRERASLHTHVGKVARPNGGSSSSPGLESSKGRMARASETASVKMAEKRRPSQQEGLGDWRQKKRSQAPDPGIPSCRVPRHR
jgi:hypothetical protein